MSFIRTGFREIALKVKRQRTRMALRYEKRLLQKSEINLGREGTTQAANFPELRNEIVALKKLEQEQKEVAFRIAQIEEGIEKVEEERQRNKRDQDAAMSKLEAEKKPLLQQRNQVKNALDLCERELTAVERRIQASDTADRDLLKQLSDLHALKPPPADLEARSASISTRRARLPEERAELVRARLGSADAARLAKEKLIAAEAELSVVEKNIQRVRTEFEARDRKLNDNIRAQQGTLREARALHQTVEERKNPAYLNIGRHLASQGIAPPNAPHLLTAAHRHREAVDRHLQHRAELALLSGQINKEWLPQGTDTILSINTEQFERADLQKRWRKDQPDIWPKTWSGLIGSAASTPGLQLPHDAARITRAVTTDEPGNTREFVLVEARRDVSRAIRMIASDKTFQKRTISGLPVWERAPALAVARVGPATLAVGAPNEVDELVLVRLGMKADLKITGQLFDRFQALDRESALRLISRDPSDLSRIFHPIFARELLEVPQLLGLAVTLQNPVKAKLLLKMSSSKSATEFARNLHDAPQQWLRLADSELLLYSQPPEIQRQGNSNLELRFAVPENSARLLLERLAKTDTAEVVTAR